MSKKLVRRWPPLSAPDPLSLSWSAALSGQRGRDPRPHRAPSGNSQLARPAASAGASFSFVTAPAFGVNPRGWSASRLLSRVALFRLGRCASLKEPPPVFQHGTAPSGSEPLLLYGAAPLGCAVDCLLSQRRIRRRQRLTGASVVSQACTELCVVPPNCRRLLRNASFGRRRVSGARPAFSPYLRFLLLCDGICTPRNAILGEYASVSRIRLRPYLGRSTRRRPFDPSTGCSCGRYAPCSRNPQDHQRPPWPARGQLGSPSGYPNLVWNLSAYTLSKKRSQSAPGPLVGAEPQRGRDRPFGSKPRLACKSSPNRATQGGGNGIASAA
jgi:hypothetical protein